MRLSLTATASLKCMKKKTTMTAETLSKISLKKSRRTETSDEIKRHWIKAKKSFFLSKVVVIFDKSLLKHSIHLSGETEQDADWSKQLRR